MGHEAACHDRKNRQVDDAGEGKNGGSGDADALAIAPLGVFGRRDDPGLPVAVDDESRAAINDRNNENVDDRHADVGEAVFEAGLHQARKGYDSQAFRGMCAQTEEFSHVSAGDNESRYVPDKESTGPSSHGQEDEEKSGDDPVDEVDVHE